MPAHISDRVLDSYSLTSRVCEFEKKFRRLFAEPFSRRNFFGRVAPNGKMPSSRVCQICTRRKRYDHIPLAV